MAGSHLARRHQGHVGNSPHHSSQPRNLKNPRRVAWSSSPTRGNWGEAWKAWVTGEARGVSPIHCEQLSPQEWRLTDQGVRQMLAALDDGVTMDTARKWLDGPLAAWRKEDPLRATKPPEPPVGLTAISSFALAHTKDPLARPLTNGELRQIQDRYKKATPAPWIVCREHPIIGGIGGPVCYMDEDEDVCVGQAGDFGPTNDAMDDGKFIAHARSDVPRLLHDLLRTRGYLKAALYAQK